MLLVAMMLSLSFPAAAQYTPPLGANPQVGGPRTQMLTLASTHLSGHSGKWSPAWLEPLLRPLVAWRPQLVTIEQLSGSQCESMRGNPVVFGEIFETYCRDATPFQRALRMSQPQAGREAERLLASWPARPTPAQRRQLAMLFLAAGDFGSAMVQWLRLPAAERVAVDGLTEDALKFLTRSNGRMNESYDVAAVVAARVGLERVHAIDDHTSDGIFQDVDPGYGPWQQARFDRLRGSQALARLESAEAAVRDGQSLLAYYRAMNAAHALDAQAGLDFGGAFADGHPERFGRLYGAWWETRNLRMVANIREATALHPGARVLNIVGASHKPWFDQWARQMGDVEVVAADEILGD
ncbi:DUF5694 domain-containing protein [Luteimonas vadosa]|uniref:DUF5694 domain-containing protein n=1 Tax=Luteimonas vadosa TaxID=1165507 RepID=A0ABP9DP33_9GAMM